MSSLFLSYARNDAAVARKVAAFLGKAGYDVWWDHHLRGGAQFSKQIEAALESADAVVVLWSRAAVESAWVRDEAAVARDTSRLIPLSIDGTAPPLGFRQFHVLPWEKGREQDILDAIAGLTGAPMLEPASLTARPVARRGLLAGAGAGVALACAGIWWLRPRAAKASPEVQALLDQAWTAWTQGSAEGNAQAIGLYHRAANLDPDFADSWGFLGCAYGDRGHVFAAPGERAALWDRARDAARRALQIDPKNAYGRAADAYARPTHGNWLLMERAFRQALQDQPGKWLITYSLGILLMQVGRLNDAIGFFAQLKGSAPTATQYFFHVNALWGAGRLTEAESLLNEASSIFGEHPMIWKTRFDLALYGGRASTALAMIDDVQNRPKGLSQEDVLALRTLADAIANGGEQRVNAAATEQLKRARVDAGQAIEAVKNLSGINRIDDAFAVADAVYLSRGFAVPDFAGRQNRAATVTLDDRETRPLFLPPAKAMRADPRFAQLMRALGLDKYWQASGSKPD